MALSRQADTKSLMALMACGLPASAMAAAGLCAVLGGAPAGVLIDGNLSPCGRCGEWDEAAWGRGQPIVGGDALEPAISAASIVAKEWRDRMMLHAAAEYPEYGWDTNMGYPTVAHRKALTVHGSTPLHRSTFKWAPPAPTLFDPSD